jgi:hypothetical protein
MREWENRSVGAMNFDVAALLQCAWILAEIVFGDIAQLGMKLYPDNLPERETRSEQQDSPLTGADIDKGGLRVINFEIVQSVHRMCDFAWRVMNKLGAVIAVRNSPGCPKRGRIQTVGEIEYQFLHGVF